jgi:hypothetical protein
MFPRGQRVADFVDYVRQDTGYDDLNAVWLTGALIPIIDNFDDWYDPSLEYDVTDDDQTPPGFAPGPAFADRGLRLSAKGLSNVPSSVSIDDVTFVFVFGSGRYECPRCIANFLSPRLCRASVGGLPQEEFVFETQLTVDDFGRFISHCFSSFSGLTYSERDLFISIARELGNWELYSLLAIDCKGLSNSSLAYFRGCVFRNDFDSFSGEEIGLLASQFHELPETLLKDCPIDFLSALLSHRDLRIKDEDSLLTFLSSLWTVDPAYFVLSEFIRFEYLSVSQIDEFLESSFPFVGELNSGIWRSICRRLIISGHFEKAGRVILPFNGASPLHGIIRYLTEKCQGNVHTRGAVTITTNSSGDSVACLADLDADNCFYSANAPDQWFCYDFKDRRVVLTHYIVRPHQWAKYNPRSWVVESSNDGESWIELDRKVSCDDLSEVHVIRGFPISIAVQGRMVRFRHTGRNLSGSYYLCLTAFEVYGTLLQKDAQ